MGAWGWEWIFYVNIPVGVIGFILAQRLLPTFATTAGKLDTVGVVLSGAGLLLVVFGVQEGATYDWGTISGPITIWSVIAIGLVFLIAFVIWEARQGEHALMPLHLFRDRGFALANTAITAIGFAITIFALPIILWAQDVRGFTTIQSALLLLPMAAVTVVLSPIFGRNLGRWSARLVASFGVLCFIGGLLWFAWLIDHNAEWGTLIAPSALIGIANASMWGALSVTATRNLDPAQAGAGSGVFNATRQFGSVRGSAAMAAVINARVTANFPAQTNGSDGTPSGTLPDFLHAPFSAAMGQSLLLPVAVLVLALLACIALPQMPKRGPSLSRPVADVSAN